MKSSTLLDSIVFQLTPTRTRCDLAIIADGKTEKIASGLLNPFLAHLKAAQDQIGKGGYSIVLQPDRSSNAAWFTKGTAERFVRFVSTPEILERVHTIESEILQIEKAISLQRNNGAGLRTHTGERTCWVKSEECTEGRQLVVGGSEEKAIVLYESNTHLPEADGSTTQEGNPKLQLLRVLESRRNVLRKEQGMAFARAVAAGFDIDNIAALLSFALCFGASRMREACKRFMDLWKAKHENGQWFEAEAPDLMPYRSEFPSMNASSVVISNSAANKNEFKEPRPQVEVASENKGVSTAAATATADLMSQVDHEAPKPKDYLQGQFTHPMLPQWPIHPQATGLPVFQAYPMQGMPYYQDYTFPPPYPSSGDSRLHAGERMQQRRLLMDDVDASSIRKQDNVDKEEEESIGRRERKKKGTSSRKESGKVIIRNINYIASAKQSSSDSSLPSSDSEVDEGNKQVDAMRKSERKGCCPGSNGAAETYDKKREFSGQEGHDGHWQVFQNFLLGDADYDDNSARFMEENIHGRRQHGTVDDDSSVIGAQCLEADAGTSNQYFDTTRNMNCMLRPSDDQMLASGEAARFSHGVGSMDAHMDVQFAEAGGSSVAWRRSADENADCMIHGENKLIMVWDSSLDAVIANQCKAPDSNHNRSLLRGMVDESFIIPQRFRSSDCNLGDDRTAIDMDAELQAVHQEAENNSDRTRIQSGFEPNDLNLMPDRVAENGPTSYDPALDYEMQAHVEDVTKLNCKKEVTSDAKQGSKRVGKEQRLKSDRKMAVITRREKPSKLSPSDDACDRAEKLRAFKADLQKLKKEREEEEIKRLEALKMERQKRIAARSNANCSQSMLPSQQTRKLSLTKLSPGSHRSSKFSDAEPGSSSPLQRSNLRTSPGISADCHRTPRPVKSNSGGCADGNRLTFSAPLPGACKEDKSAATSDSKATVARIQRLSGPKSSSNAATPESRAPMVEIRRYSSDCASLVKTQSAEAVSARRFPEMKRISVAKNLEKTSFGTLPELKLKTSEEPSDVAQKKSTAKETSQMPVTCKFSNTSASPDLSRGNHKVPSDEDDNIVVEKTVVMLECEKTSGPALHASEEDACNQNTPEDPLTVLAIASPLNVQEDHRESIDIQSGVQSHINEAAADTPSADITEKPYEPPYARLSSVEDSSAGVSEMPYEPPYARVSSLEDHCTVKSDYGKAPQISLEMPTRSTEITTARVPDIQRQNVEKVLEPSQKIRGKQSPKGLKRIWMFGRKNHSSTAGESSMESDKASLDGSTADDNAMNGSSGKVFTLKSLISQEDVPRPSTSHKVSRFSFLSPFRRKTREKKPAT